MQHAARFPPFHTAFSIASLMPSARQGQRIARLRRFTLGAPAQVQVLRLLVGALLLWKEHLSFSVPCSAPGPSRSSGGKYSKLDILLAADPQIIDAHTYPHLGAALRAVVLWASDTYARRAWRGVGRSADAVVWLGDLTDGGRRVMSEAQWTKLHDRFDALFAPTPPALFLAGNHDLGLDELRAPSREIPVDVDAHDRWLARYGTRVAKSTSGALTHGVWADGTNATMVERRYSARARQTAHEAVAMAQGSPENYTRSLSAKVPVFLNGKEKASHELVIIDALALVGVESALGERSGAGINARIDSVIKDRFPELWATLESLKSSAEPIPPRIMLQHIPLYRAPNTACNLAGATHGVLRESQRALSQGEDFGHTYQNEIGEAVSAYILERVRPLVVFSGDDHDHCEVLHARPQVLSEGSTTLHNVAWLNASATVPELTIKAFSMTEGVRRPGYAKLSIFVDRKSGIASASYKPCLLPDQLSTWIWFYPFLVVLVAGALWAWQRSQLGARRTGPVPPRRRPRMARGGSDESWEKVGSDASSSSDERDDNSKRIRYGGPQAMGARAMGKAALLEEFVVVAAMGLLFWVLLQLV